jgi:hypothetical protein
MMEKYLEQMTSAAADRAKLIELKRWKEDNKILAQDTSTLEKNMFSSSFTMFSSSDEELDS